MAWTKREFIEAAFDELTLADYVFDLSPEDLQSVLKKLDAMMATWNGLGIRIGYPLPSSPSTSDIDASTNVPDSANEAIYTNLAMRVGPSFGKVVSNETKVTAKQGFNLLLSRSAQPPQMQLPGTLPAGAGNIWGRVMWSPFVNKPVDRLTAGPDSFLNL